MGKYDEMLRNAGIKVVSNNTSHFYSSLGFKNVNAGAGRSERFGIDNTQKSWTNKALNPIPHAAPWSYISAPGMGHFDAQQTIESFQNFRQRIGRILFLCRS